VKTNRVGTGDPPIFWRVELRPGGNEWLDER
jgi:hypothetical protein